MQDRVYAAIDLKSFYASVECVERGLDPMTAHLVVADPTRTEKTICLAVSPALKSYGIPGRARLFEAVQIMKKVNSERLNDYRRKIHDSRAVFKGESADSEELKTHPELAAGFVTAPPQMAHYMEFSTKIYEIYLKYVSQEDIHVYSIDEVFIDLMSYLKTYRMTAHELTMTIIRDVLSSTGITATAGIGTNLYLCKIAMDIVAKKMPADKDGVRIAELDEMSYRRLLWEHRPLTDFWRIGRGYSDKLEAAGLYTMGDIARFSIDYEDCLFKMFGVNAELLIDHAWGYEPCTIADIKGYRPENNSLCSGQVLQEPCDFEQTRLIVREMADMLALELAEKGLVTSQITLTIGYDIKNLTDDKIKNKYSGEVKTDRYGRKVPKHSHGTANLSRKTASSRLITDAVTELYEKITNGSLLIRRITLTANNIVAESSADSENDFEQLDFFTDYEEKERTRRQEEQCLEREKKQQRAILDIKRKFGKNAIIKGMSLQEGATARSRNDQIGGHKA
ncbi:MAG: DNA methylase [Ruminococcus sp.]|nr:DNA methylase [Ruminococcus sp.]